MITPNGIDMHIPNLKVVHLHLPYLDLKVVKKCETQKKAMYKEGAARFVRILNNSPSLTKVLAKIVVMNGCEQEMDSERNRGEVKDLLEPLQDLANVEIVVEVVMRRLGRDVADPELTAYGNSLWAATKFDNDRAL
jgi:hypothetical protein